MARASLTQHRRVRPRPLDQAPVGRGRTTVRVPAAAAPPATPLEVACGLIGEADSVVLLAHVQPDADALGSALALGIALTRAGASVQVSFSEPAGVPDSLRGLPGQQLITPPDEVDESPDLLITMDVNSAGRLGALGRLTATAAHTLVVDHHASNTRFGTHHLVDTRAESTTVLVAELLDRMGLPIDADVAANLYAGLATDSVGFRHASARAHRLAARLLEAGVRPDELMRPITDVHPVGWLAMVSAVLARAELVPAGPAGALIWTSITVGDAIGMRSEELDSVIDIVRTTAEARVAAVLKQSGIDEWQVSLRSLPGVDVAAVATRLGGGGHVRAAGYTAVGTAEQVAAELVRALSD